MNRKQQDKIKMIAVDWAVLCSKTATAHNMTPKEAFEDPALAANFLADELGTLLYGPSFMLQRNAKGFDDRAMWNEAVYILVGCFPDMQVELVHLLTDAPKRDSFSVRTVKDALKRLIGDVA